MMILIFLLCLLIAGCTGLPADTPQQVTTLSPPPTTAITAARISANAFLFIPHPLQGQSMPGKEKYECI